MATILKFASARGRAAASDGASQPARKRKTSAQIIIFPGVRYERRQTNENDKPQPTPRSRDRLELVD